MKRSSPRGMRRWRRPIRGCTATLNFTTTSALIRPWTPRPAPHAWLQGQAFVSPENIRAVAPACLAHRVHLSYEAEAAGKTRNDVMEALLKAVVAA